MSTSKTEAAEMRVRLLCHSNTRYHYSYQQIIGHSEAVVMEVGEPDAAFGQESNWQNLLTDAIGQPDHARGERVGEPSELPPCIMHLTLQLQLQLLLVSDC
jgi:hypothetical protein